MWRILFYILLAIAITFGLLYLVEFLPGYFTLDIGSYHVSLSYVMALIIILALIMIAIFADRLIRSILGLSIFSSKSRRANRKYQSYNKLTEGLVAMAAGDSKKALQLAQKAEKMDSKNPLTCLLIAQTSLLNKDVDEAHKKYTELLKDKKTRLMGYRGLYLLAVESGNYDEALVLIKRAYELHPSSLWVFEALFELHISQHQFKEALPLIRPAVKRNHLPVQKGQHLAAVLETEIARLKLKEEEVDQKSALSHLENARKAQKDFIPALSFMVEIFVDQKQDRQAKRMISEIWKINPQASMIPHFEKLNENLKDEAIFKAAKKLYQLNPKHEESRIFFAQMALRFKKFDMAQEQLNHLLNDYGTPQQRTYRLLAELEDLDETKRNPEQIREYILKMATARFAPAWICDGSMAILENWQAISPAGKLDGLKWKEPSSEINLLDIPATHITIERETSNEIPSLLADTDIHPMEYKEDEQKEEIIEEILEKSDHKEAQDIIEDMKEEDIKEEKK